MNKDSSIRSILTSEVKFVIATITLAATVGIPYFGMKSDIALIQQSILTIQNNHEVHIKDILEEVKELKAADRILSDKLISTNETMVKLMTLISKQ